MRSFAASGAALLLAAIAWSQAGASTPPRVDDPPPELGDCPLCGGDPKVHAEKTFAILGSGADLLARALRF